MDTHALARESLSQPKRPATPRLQEPQRPSPPPPPVTLSPFRQRPATEPDDETAQQLAQKSSFALDHLTDAELLGSTRSMVGRSNVVFAALLAHLAEVEARRVFRERACSSLYAYCVYELRMSEDAAQRRVQAARLVRKFPELLEVVAAGELHLTGLLLLGPHLTHENLAQVLPLAKHRSKREILALVRRLDPKPNALARIEPLGPAIVNAACGGTWEQWIGSFAPVNHLQPGDRPRDWIPCDAGATVEVPGAGGRTDDRSTPGDGGNADAGARVHGGEDAGVVSGTLLPVGAQVLGREDPRGVSGTMLPAGAQVHGEENAGVVSGTMLPVGAQVHGDTDPGVVSEDLLPASTQVHSEDPRGVSGTMLPAGTRPAQGSLTAPQRYTVQFTASEEHVQLLQEARDLLGPALKGRAIEEVHLRAMRALVRELKKRKFAMVEGPRAAAKTGTTRPNGADDADTRRCAVNIADSRQRVALDDDSRQRAVNDGDTRRRGSDPDQTREGPASDDDTRRRGADLEDTRQRGSAPEDSRRRGSNSEDTRQRVSSGDARQPDAHGDNTRRRAVNDGDTRQRGSDRDDTRECADDDDTRRRGSNSEDTRQRGSSDSRQPDAHDDNTRRRAGRDDDTRRRGSNSEDTRQRVSPGDGRESSRHIPAWVRRAVWERDGGRCTYRDCGAQRCRERSGLEFHHEVAFAKRGRHTVANVCLRCKPHNALAAEQDFGEAHMARVKGDVPR